MRIVKQLLLGLACVMAGFIVFALAQPTKDGSAISPTPTSTGSPPTQPTKKGQTTLSIVFDPRRGYKIDGKATSINKLEGVLRESIRAKSEHSKVTVLLHLNSRVADLYFLKGLLQAIGFMNTLFFWFTDDREMMAEIVVDRPAIPFSLAPTNVSRPVIITPPVPVR